MSETKEAAEEKGAKIVRYFTPGPATITVKDAEGQDREVANPDFRFYRGIPARDLTEADWRELSDEQKATVDKGHVVETKDTGRRDAKNVPILEEVRETLYARTRSSRRKD
jgi:hypothetical protein